MKIIFTLLIAFVLINTSYAQNASLDRANNAVYNAISPSPKPYNPVVINYNHVENIKVYNNLPVFNQIDINFIFRDLDRVNFNFPILTKQPLHVPNIKQFNQIKVFQEYL